MNGIIRILGLTAVIAALAAPSAFAYKADYAIYNPGTSGDGVWDDEVKAIKAVLKNYGWSYKSVGPEQLNSGELMSGSGALNYRALLSPGGWAYQRELATTVFGERNLREFVKAGGGFVGLCAGSYWAADTVSFAENATGGGGKYNVASDYQDYDYQLALFKGTAKGPFAWTPWDGDATLELADINNSNSTMDKIDMPGKTRFYYAGGPFFIPSSEKPANYEVWAKAVMPDDVSSKATIGKNQPSVIRFTEGKGNVVLFAYHPTILIKNASDNVEVPKEDKIKWDKGSQSYKEIALYSWNILHAAVQVAGKKKPTEVTKLPK